VSAAWAAAALELYEGALRDAGRGGPALLETVGEDGARRRFPVERWLRRPDEHESDLLDRAVGPVLDVGCGAGRHVAALRRRGVEAVGIEVSGHAAALARARGAEVIEGCVFAHPLPSTWTTALLLDGNIGIGGDPAGLLRRVAALLRPGGAALVELEPPLTPCRSSRVRLEGPDRRSGWIDWSFVAADCIDRLAGDSGFEVVERWSADGRWFARLRCGEARWPR
jgi:SAM-dependent methyltransferase